MIPEFGHFALILAPLLAIAQVVFGLGGAWPTRTITTLTWLQLPGRH